MGFLDKAREKAEALAGQAKDKIEDVQAKRKADDLLDDLGRISYRQQTNRGEPGDEVEIARIVAELRILEDDGAPVLTAKANPESTGPLAPPSDGSAFAPPPPPAPDGGADIAPS